MDKKKITKILLVILSILLVFSVIAVIVTNIKNVHNATAGLTEKQYLNLVSVESTYKEQNYTKQNISADNIIGTAAKYLGTKYGHGKGYSDAYDRNGDDTARNMKLKNSTTEFLQNPTNLDCSGIVYTTLRQLNVRLIGFDDNSSDNGVQYGPIPLGTQGWVQKHKDINKWHAYNIKWANGDNIARIVDYQKKGVTVNGRTINSYDDFIKANNIAKGSIIVALNPNERSKPYVDLYRTI